MNLLEGYKVCRDLEFVDYIKKKENFYEEGGDVTADQLMEWALNKFKSRTEGNVWCQKTSEEETIIALQAQVKTLLKGTGSNTGGTNSKEQKKSKKAKKDNKPAWMKVAPSEGDPHTKQVDGKEWNWCPAHSAWVRHKAAECQGIGFRGGTNKGNSNQTSKDDPKMKISNALAALKGGSDEDDEDTDDEEE